MHSAFTRHIFHASGDHCRLDLRILVLAIIATLKTISFVLVLPVLQPLAELFPWQMPTAAALTPLTL